MEKKFLLVIKNNKTYKVLEYLYTQKIISLEQVKKDIINEYINC